MSSSKAPNSNNILIVEDHPTMLKMMKRSLSDLRIPIHTAVTGKEALQKAKAIHPSIILLDIVLPDMNGTEASHRILRDPSIPRCSIIFLSSLNDIESKVESFAQGGVDFINKPFEPEELQARVTSHLHLRDLEQRLEQKNLHLEYTNQRILETLSEGIIGIDALGMITFINESAQRILHCNHPPKGRPIAEILPIHLNTNNTPSGDIFKNIYKNGAPYKNDCKYITLDNQQIALQINGSPIIENDTCLGAVITIKEITLDIENQEKLQLFQKEIKSQREQLTHMERLYTLGEMAAGFAHEINQPLTAIKNFSSASLNILKDPNAKIDIEAYLEQIINQAERSGKIINRLKSFISKPEVEKETISIVELISETIKFISHEIKTHHITLIDKIDDKEAVIQGDKIQIQQILINLIKNSMDAMDSTKQGHQIEIHATKKFESGFYTIIVSDNGKGISPDMQKMLFHPFQTNKENGMGIGLTICETIMHAHNGFISFESQPSLTSFYLNFPLQDQTNNHD